jgi:TetR/AcrR family transcriptional repressor of nem operon
MMATCVLSEAVLDKIMLLFWEQGYFHTSIQDLTAATGFNRAALYKHFGGKHGLFLAMLQRFRGKVVVEATSAIQDPSLGMEGIKSFFMQFVQCSLETITAHSCFMLATASNLPQDEPEVAGVIAEFIHHLRALFYKNLRWQQAARQLNADINPEVTADFLVGNVVGLMSMLRTSSDPRMITNQVKGVLEYLDSLPSGRSAAQGNLHLIS